MNELYHHGILGQKWGVRRFQNKDGTLTNARKKRKQTYREKVESSVQEYDKQHPGRSKKDNYTIALRDAARKEESRATKTALASMLALPASALVGAAGSLALGPVGAGIGVAAAGVSMMTINAGNMLVAQKRMNTLSEISDEHNIQNAKRVLNV